jgi:hypothetical protein
MNATTRRLFVCSLTALCLVSFMLIAFVISAVTVRTAPQTALIVGWSALN